MKPISFKVILFVIVIFVSPFYTSVIDDYPVLVGDQTWYILLGTSIASGHGYRALWLPGQPEHTKYPFLYPALLSIPIYFLGYNFFAIRFINLIFLLITLFAVYTLFKRRTNGFTAAMLVFLTACSCPVFYYVYHAFSEIVFLGFSLVSLVAIERYLKDSRQAFGNALLAAIAVACAYFTRIIGFSLILAVIVYFLFERKNLSLGPKPLGRFFLFLVIIFIFVGMWTVRNMAAMQHGGSGDYIKEVMNLSDPFDLDRSLSPFRMVVQNAYAFVFYSFPYLVSNFVYPRAHLIALLLSIMVAAGFFATFFRKRSIIEYYFIFYLVILLFISWSNYARRFFVPLVPIVFYYFLEGVRVTLERIRINQRAQSAVWTAFLAAMIFYSAAVFGTYVSHKPNFQDPAPAQVSDFLSCAAWVKGNTPSKAVFLGINPTDVYLYFERQCLPIPLTRRDLPLLLKEFQRKQIDYIVVSGIYSRLLSDKFFKNLSASHVSVPRFVEVHREGDTTIYRVEGDSSEPFSRR